MRLSPPGTSRLLQLFVLAALPVRVLSADVLKTSGFTSCLDDSAISVTKLHVEYDRAKGTVTFDVGGNSAKVQNVTASLTVSAYGNQVYTKDFNPCLPGSKVAQLCPGQSPVKLPFTFQTRSHSNLRSDSPRRLFLCQGQPTRHPKLRESDTFHRLHHTRSRWRGQDGAQVC